MKSYKIVTVVGARPQFVKAAVVSRVFNQYDNIEEVIIHTGQHFDPNMSDVFFTEMNIPKPKYNLDIHGVGHGAMTGRMLEGIEEILIEEKPDLMLVYGDTNSTIAGALAAKKIHIPVGHVEAGLRSFNMEMPEEINRILTDRISDILFCPTDNAIENLEKEGVANTSSQVVRTGDVMCDAAYFYAKNSNVDVTELRLPNEFVVCTLHRAENTDDKNRLESFVSGLNKIHDEVCPVVLPLHPRTKQKLKQYNLQLNVHIVEPVGYMEMIYLLENCKLVLTDSGGLQKEAFFFKKQCITMRDQTEWVELVNGGFNKLVAPSDDLVSVVQETIKNEIDFNVNLYGKGDAGEEIVKHILTFLSK
jgi:UDP-GlcNAc3NAcA epimerase